MIVRHIKRAGGWFRQHHKRVIVIGVVGLVVLLTIIQLRYPADLLLPFTRIDGVKVGGWSKANVILALDANYRDTSTTLYFGTESNPYTNVKPSDIGVTVKNDERIRNLDYPLYLRLIPGSIFWGNLVINTAKPSYSHNDTVLSVYIKDRFGDECKIEPTNATLKIVNKHIKVQKGSPGGTCTLSDIKSSLSTLEPSLITDNKLTLPVNVIKAEVGDGSAQALADQIEKGIKNGVTISTDGVKADISRDMLIDWLDFTVTNGTIDYAFNTDKATKYLTDKFASKVAVSAGTTTIHTYNFAETSRETGRSGQVLDIPATLARVKSFVNGDLETISPATAPIAPTISYVRNYSTDYEGLAALMKNFASTHAGSYGVVLNELSGKYRRATYQSTKSFTTASTYKLYVAYSTLRRIEDGSWHWTDQIAGGRDLTKCFDDMIVVSDNACGHALILKLGSSAITNDAHAIGCVNTSFLGSDGLKTTPEDLALLLGLLQTNQILTKQSSRDTLINAMKRNIYRQGIPAGESGVVADKVGFLDGLLHDAAIVYSSTGPYILVIMTDGSSWGNIAQLTREIEALRIQ
jgi:beta-lactamase class A